MRKTLFTLFLILLQTTLWAQAPNLLWQTCLGGTGYDVAFNAQATPDGGYIVGGYTNSNNGNVAGNHGNSDAWIVKLSSNGSLDWQKCIGGSSSDNAFDILKTNDGGYILVGYTSSNDGDVSGNQGQFDAWLIKLSSFGIIEWQRLLGGTGLDQMNSVQQTPDGGYVAAGHTYSNNGDVVGTHGIQEAWVVKLSSAGTLQWQKPLGGTQNDEASGIQITADGGYIVVGSTLSNDGQVTGTHGGYDAWVMKLSSTGDLEWQKALGGTLNDRAFAVQQTTEGGYIVAGSSSSNDGDVSGNHGGDDAWVVKLSTNGAVEWQKTLGGTNNESAQSIQLTSDGGYVLSGFVGSNNGDVTGSHGTNDMWAVKLSSAGILQWQKPFGGTNSDWAYSIQLTPDGGFILSGITISINGDVSGNNGGWDAWVIKLGPELITPSFANQELKLYPSPTTNLLNIQTPNNIKIDKITISDLTGKVVIMQTENTNQVEVAQLARGFYLLEIISDKERKTGRFAKE
jgi:hypothetical protein